MKNKQQIKKVLMLLEKSVSSDMDTSTVELIAKKHLFNEKRISDLQVEVQKLIDKQNSIAQDNSDLEDDILNIIGETKSQSFRFGKILVDFKITKQSGTTKDSPQYKTIVAELTKQYNIEERIITKLKEDFNNGNKTFSNSNKELSITKESRQLKENLLKTIWMRFKQVFQMLFKSFKNQNDYLESLVKSMK